MNKFDSLYQKIATTKNYVEPIPDYCRMDNWAVDRFRLGDYFTGMADAGYSRWIGRYDSNGKVLWRVTEIYGRPMEYSGISVDEFESLAV